MSSAAGWSGRASQGQVKDEAAQHHRGVTLRSGGAGATTLVVVSHRKLVGPCLEQLSSITGETSDRVVVAVPHVYPSWWVLSVTAGYVPTHIVEHDVSHAARISLDRLLREHPEHEGLDVRFLSPPLEDGVAALLACERVDHVVVVTDRRRRSAQVRRLRRALSAQRLTVATLR